MKKQTWGADDQKALNRLVLRAGGVTMAAEALASSAVSIWRWRSGESPRYPGVVRGELKKYGCYQVRGRVK